MISILVNKIIFSTAGAVLLILALACLGFRLIDR